MHPLRHRTALPTPRAGEPPVPTAEEIEQEWLRRAGGTGHARVMPASQPDELTVEVTVATERQLAGHLCALETRLGRPLGGALEVGCGVGRLTPTIAAHVERVLAIDMTEPMLDEARTTCAGLANVAFYRCAAQRLPLSRSRMDVAVCVWVLMHVLDRDELAAACRGIARCADHLVLMEYEHAAVPVGRYSRPRTLEEYLTILPGARLIERGEVHYGDDRSFSALIALDSQ